MVDLAVKYINECQLFFEEMGVSTALYYIDTQKIELALLQKDFQEARRLLSESVVPPGIDPDMVHIRNKYLQQFYEETGNYKRAYHYLQRNNQLDDSIRNERVRMRTADLTLRYQQDSTLIAHRVLLQEQKNKVLVLRQTQFCRVCCSCCIYIDGGFPLSVQQKETCFVACTESSHSLYTSSGEYP